MINVFFYNQEKLNFFDTLNYTSSYLTSSSIFKLYQHFMVSIKALYANDLENYSTKKQVILSNLSLDHNSAWTINTKVNYMSLQNLQATWKHNDDPISKFCHSKIPLPKLYCQHINQTVQNMKIKSEYL